MLPPKGFFLLLILILARETTSVQPDNTLKYFHCSSADEVQGMTIDQVIPLNNFVYLLRGKQSFVFPPPYCIFGNQKQITCWINQPFELDSKFKLPPGKPRLRGSLKRLFLLSFQRLTKPLILTYQAFHFDQVI